MSRPLVGIVMGSDSDMPVMQCATTILKEFGVCYEFTITSAHRSPDKSADYAKNAERRGLKVIIAAAGMAAHLAGSMAAHTTLPVIGVPIEAGALKGLDALLSTVQMPAGVPVATMTIGNAGAKNAALLAVQILALSDKKFKTKLKNHKKKMAKEVIVKDQRLKDE